MKAVAVTQYLPINNPESLVDVDLPRPVPGPRDLLVRVQAVAVNPVDAKVRGQKAPPPESPRVLGWDAAGIVEAVGAEVTLFRPGDEVFYAGSLSRAGSNAEWQTVDERIVGRKPRTLSFAAAAALPLTSITAWELLFDRFGILPNPPTGAEGNPTGIGADARFDAVLVVGAAGGVGSMVVQLARALTDLTVIGTASRPETRAWLGELGAHHIVDHSRRLPAQVTPLAPGGVRYITSLTATDQHFEDLVETLAPEGKLGLIDDPLRAIDVRALKRKSASLHWEFMFARPLHQTASMIQQHHLLNRIAALVDAGVVRSTMTEDLGPITAVNLRRAHTALESGRTRGKIVLSGF